MSNERAGHRTLPHTADVRIEAWGPDLAGCLERAVDGMVSTFADLSAARPAGTVTAEITGAAPGELLVGLLDEVIFRLDTESVLPVRSKVQPTGAGATVDFDVADVATAELIGAVPKAVSLNELVIEETPAGWRCEVTIDI